MSFDTLDKTFELDKGEIEDAKEAINRYGYSNDDFNFEVNIGTTPSNSQGLHSFQGSISAQYTPTGKKREYAIGNREAWAEEFRRDLESDFFNR